MAFNKIYEHIEKMCNGLLIMHGFLPEPKINIGSHGSHPMVVARKDAFYFNFRNKYIDETGQNEKEDIQKFLTSLIPHPKIKENFYKEYGKVAIRFEISDMIQYNPKRMYFYNGKLLQGVYEDLRGYHIRAWGELKNEE